ncbi:hypothetical protein HOF78_03405 [Candidatus Woesearchaeota archaeon]|nr:hypothetical protein [Candidatus Woesearchaeota archaeon]
MKNTMKKLSALLVLSLFVVSMVPAVFAGPADDAKALNANFLAKAEKAKNQIGKTSNHVKTLAQDVRKTLDLVRSRNKITRDDAEQVQNKLVNLLDGIQDEMENLKTGVGNTCIDNDKGNDYLDMVIAKAENLKADVQALDPQTATREDLNSVLSKMRNFYNDEFRGSMYVALGRAGNCKAQWILGNVDGLILRTTEIVDDVEARGNKDTAGARTLISNMEIDQAKLEAEYEQLQNAWSNVNSHQDAYALSQNVNSFIKNKAAPETRRIHASAVEEYRALTA